jgi:uncharacterized membrane protein YhdT
MKTVPLAICHHPWWNFGNRCYSHFYKWADGDSLLTDKLPHFTYYNYPNVIDYSYLMIVLTVLYVVFDNFLNSVGSITSFRNPLVMKKMCTILPILLATDCFLDVKLCFEDVKDDVQTYYDRTFLVIAAIEGCIIKNSSELGHLIGPIRRGKFLRVGKKFDWFFGTFDKFISNERRKAFNRMIIFISITAIVWIL